MSGDATCHSKIGCEGEPTYLIRYEFDEAEYPVCADCVAVLRANDPLDYIESVRSLRPSGVSR